MVKLMKTNVGLAIALVSCTVTTSTAQEDITPTRQLKFNVDQTFRAAENQQQNPVSAGTTLSSTTRLGFSAITLNELNDLNFNISTALRFNDTPDSDVSGEISTPRFNLRYKRNGVDSDLSLQTSYRRDDIAFVRPLDDFLDDLGEVSVPDDINDLNGTGTRIEYGANLSVQLRKNAPISLSFSLGLNGRDYGDVTGPDLTDEQTISARASAQFTFAPDFTGTLSYGRSEFTNDNAAQTQRDRENLSFDLERALSKVLTATATIGQSSIETTTINGTNSVDGVNGGLGLSLERPNGVIGLNYDSSINPNGTRQSLVFQRSLVLPTGSLSGSIGLTQLENDDSQVVSALRYSQALPSGSLALAFNQSVRFIEEDSEDREVNTITASYNYDINQLSSITFRGAATQSQNTDLSTLGVTYNYGLTADWNLSTGYNFDVLNQDGGESANRHQIFIGLSRSFDLPF